MVLNINEKLQISPRSRKHPIVESKISKIPSNKAKHWIALSLCAAVLISGLLKQLVPDRPDYTDSFAPVLISFIAAGSATRSYQLRSAISENVPTDFIDAR